MPAKKLKSYYVDFKVDASIGTKIDADSLDDALARGRAFDLSDFIDFSKGTDFADGPGLEVKGIYEI